MTHRVFNFNPGPGTLPEEALAEASAGLLDYKGTGMGVMELSHRSKPYEEIHFGLMKGIKDLLGAGDDWVVMLMQGGASTQFSVVPMNLMTSGRAAYVVTGEWSQKAVAEAQKHGTVEIAATSEGEKFGRIPRPDEIHVAEGVDYLHVTSNNTIYGTQWPGDPPAVAPPVVADMSSDFLSRPLDLSRYGLLYAGAQKNLGPAGLTVVVARKEASSPARRRRCRRCSTTAPTPTRTRSTTRRRRGRSTSRTSARSGWSGRAASPASASATSARRASSTTRSTAATSTGRRRRRRAARA